MTTKKTTAPKAVESNHNTTEPAKPVAVDNVKAVPDYNPQRKPSSRANVQTDASTTDASAVADAKGDRPTAAEVEAKDAGWGDDKAE